MNGKVKAMVAAGFLVLSTMAARAQTMANVASDTASTPAPVLSDAGQTVVRRTGGTRTILVSLKDRRLALLEDGVVKKVYRVAVGRDLTPSPTGIFTIADRVTNPTYYHSGKVIPPGPGNPVGTRWMGLNEKGYGIHGTNEPRSIGKATSHGCIRMGRRDLEEMFARVKTGDVVEIVGERDAETAAIFGMPEGPAMPAAATVVAKADPKAATGTQTAEGTETTPADR